MTFFRIQAPQSILNRCARYRRKNVIHGQHRNYSALIDALPSTLCCYLARQIEITRNRLFLSLSVSGCAATHTIRFKNLCSVSIA